MAVHLLPMLQHSLYVLHLGLPTSCLSSSVTFQMVVATHFLYIMQNCAPVT